MRDFKDRVAVVTGAASGIGRALAARFAAEGMCVVLADVERSTLDAAAKEMGSGGAEVLPVVTDVSVADEVSALAERTQEVFGAIHVLCNNAGVFAGGLSWEAPLSDYDWVFDVNVRGVIHGIRSFVPRMLAQDSEGHIVNTASMAAVTAAPFCAPYYMSKHAVMSLSETLYLELVAKGSKLRASVLCPELIDTRIGSSERNRPEHHKRDAGEHVERDLVENALVRSTAGGLPPSTMADRVVEAIRDERFYVLSPEGNGWRDACNARLDDIRAAGNPRIVVPGG